MGKNIRICPSVLAADFTRLGEELSETNSSGADMIHLDIMDGHFVPNISFGPDISRFIIENTDLPVDAHLMVKDPLFWAPRFAEIGVEYITFHDEIGIGEKGIDEIRKLGVKVGLAFNPDNSLKSLESLIDKLDLILIMTVFPGFFGQPFLEQGRKNIEKSAKLRDKLAPNVPIMVDGGINLETARLAISAGANILVVGAAFYKSPDKSAFIKQIKATIY